MKKWFKPTIVFVCAAMLLAGCQFSPSNQTKQQEITVWSFTDEAGYAIEKFEQKYPDIKVNFVNIPGNFYITKLKSALQTTSKAPDVFMIENANIRELIDVPYLENLSASPYNANELIEEQYAFVQANEKDSEGNVRAIGYQGTPGASIIVGIWRKNIWAPMILSRWVHRSIHGRRSSRLERRYSNLAGIKYMHWRIGMLYRIHMMVYLG